MSNAITIHRESFLVNNSRTKNCSCRKKLNKTEIPCTKHGVATIKEIAVVMIS